MCIRHSLGILLACSDVAVQSTTTNNMTSLTICKSMIALRLDALAVLLAKMLPIGDAGVFYEAGKPWRLDAWKEGRSYFFKVGGWTLEVDLM